MLKKILFTLLLSATLSLAAQTNANIDWGRNSTPSAAGNANSSRTIEVGGIVTWNWYAGGIHNVQSEATANESFSSDFFGMGETFSYQFNSIGTNDYICSPHPADMFGTITVVAVGTLNVQTFEDILNAINVYPNPASSNLKIDIPSKITGDFTIEVFDVLGKRIVVKQANKLSNSLDIANWNKGVYLMKISSNISGKSVTKRFVKI
ncbi:T9SS type A sorting domain-containing protein [Algibacter sp.]|nr:T9SS type A sorting domain-containing protein [Algibacter sp.]